LLLLERYDEESIINVGCGEDVTIRQLCETIMRVTGYAGRLEFDASKPDGTPRKLLDVSKLTQLGWRPRISLRDGIQQVYDWYRAQASPPRRVSGAGE
jgi:GDP-L-fucose synthase